jgi:hypothetical protein
MVRREREREREREAMERTQRRVCSYPLLFRFTDELEDNPLLAKFITQLVADWDADDIGVFLSNLAVVPFLLFLPL